MPTGHQVDIKDAFLSMGISLRQIDGDPNLYLGAFISDLQQFNRFHCRKSFLKTLPETKHVLDEWWGWS